MTIPTNDDLGRIAFDAAKASIDAVTPERWADYAPTWETLGDWDATAPAAHIAAAVAVRDAVLEGLAGEANRSGAGDGGLELCNWGGTVSDWLRAHLTTTTEVIE